MASPFARFRKNQKKYLAFFGVALMISFALGAVGIQYFIPDPRQGDYAVVAETSLGEINGVRMRSMVGERQLAKRFMGEFFQFDPFGPADEESVMDKYLKVAQAKKLGIVISNAAIDQFIRQARGGLIYFRDEDGKRNQEGEALNPQRLKAAASQFRIDLVSLYRILRDELLAMQLEQMIVASTASMTPAERWRYWQMVNRRSYVEALPLPVKEFARDSWVENVSELSAGSLPSLRQMKKFFDDHRDRVPQGYSDQPGFKLPHLAQFQYVKVNNGPFLEAAKAVITNSQIGNEYARITSQRNVPAKYLYSREEMGLTDEEEKTEEGADDKESDGPEKKSSSTPKDKKSTSSVSPRRERTFPVALQDEEKTAKTKKEGGDATAGTEKTGKVESKTAKSGKEKEGEKQPKASGEDTKEQPTITYPIGEDLNAIGREFQIPENILSGSDPKYLPLWKVIELGYLRDDLAQQQATKDVKNLLGRLRNHRSIQAMQNQWEEWWDTAPNQVRWSYVTPEKDRTKRQRDLLQKYIGDHPVPQNPLNDDLLDTVFDEFVQAKTEEWEGDYRRELYRLHEFLPPELAKILSENNEAARRATQMREEWESALYAPAAELDEPIPADDPLDEAVPYLLAPVTPPLTRAEFTRESALAKTKVPRKFGDREEKIDFAAAAFEPGFLMFIPDEAQAPTSSGQDPRRPSADSPPAAQYFFWKVNDRKQTAPVWELEDESDLEVEGVPVDRQLVLDTWRQFNSRDFALERAREIRDQMRRYAQTFPVNDVLRLYVLDENGQAKVLSDKDREEFIDRGVMDVEYAVFAMDKEGHIDEKIEPYKTDDEEKARQEANRLAQSHHSHLFVVAQVVGRMKGPEKKSASGDPQQKDKGEESKKDSGKKDSGKKDSGKKDSGKKDSGKKDSSKKDKKTKNKQSAKGKEKEDDAKKKDSDAKKKEDDPFPDHIPIYQGVYCSRFNAQRESKVDPWPGAPETFTEGAFEALPPFAWYQPPQRRSQFNFFPQLELRPVKGMEFPGDDFMNTVFSLQPGETGVAYNLPKDIVVVAQVTRHDFQVAGAEYPSDFGPPLDSVQQAFIGASPEDFELLNQREMQKLHQQLLDSLHKEYHLTWRRDPKSGG